MPSLPGDEVLSMFVRKDLSFLCDIKLVQSAFACASICFMCFVSMGLGVKGLAVYSCL